MGKKLAKAVRKSSLYTGIFLAITHFVGMYLAVFGGRDHPLFPVGRSVGKWQ
jgi:hypothetical protein